MKSSARIAVVLILFAASASHAQQVLVGQMNPRVEVFFTSSVAGTLIDINNPANAAGVLTTATVQWVTNVSPCATTFRIRFYRQLTAGTLSMVAERGPFTATTGAAMSIPLTPSVSVNAGDLIGVAMFSDVNCGVGAAQSLGNQTFLAIPGDFTGGSTTSASVRSGAPLSLRASSSDSVLVGVIPAVGSVFGVGGAAFRTTFQTTNEGDSPLKVIYRYHPAKVPGSESDISTTLAIAPHATDSTDVLAAMGVTGLGSLDVLSATWAPLVTAHVFNDTANGTNGFIEPMVSVKDVIHSAATFRLVIPNDTTNYRMNIGSRSLTTALHLGCLLYDAAGQQIGTVSKSYPANYFEQVPLQEFIGASVAIPPAGTLDCQPFFGDLAIYSSITDNRTNDSAIYIARH
jgi:hypothetical protein